MRLVLTCCWPQPPACDLRLELQLNSRWAHPAPCSRFGRPSCELLLPLPPQDIAFEAGLEISAHILAVLPAAVVGLVSGVLGIGFVLLNIKISRLRDVLLSRFKWRRCIEPCVLAVVYVTGTMLLPRLFPCTPTHCVTYNHQVYCNIQNLTAAAEGTAPPPNTPPLQLPLYTCSIVSADTNQSWIPSSGTITPDTPTNASAIVYYNELATLMLNTGGALVLVGRGVVSGTGHAQVVGH